MVTIYGARSTAEAMIARVPERRCNASSHFGVRSSGATKSWRSFQQRWKSWKRRRRRWAGGQRQASSCCSALRSPGLGGARSTSLSRRQGRSCRAGAPRSSSRSKPGWYALRVQDGQAVKAGDVLIELDPTVNAADRDHLQSDLLAARLRAAFAGGDDPLSDFTPPADAHPSLVSRARIPVCATAPRRCRARADHDGERHADRERP